MNLANVWPLEHFWHKVARVLLLPAVLCFFFFLSLLATNQSIEKGEVERVTEEIPFALDVWMNYYPFLLFTNGTACWWITAPGERSRAVVNAFTLDPVRQHPGGGGRGVSVTCHWPEPQPQSVAKLLPLTVISTMPVSCKGVEGSMLV